MQRKTIVKIMKETKVLTQNTVALASMIIMEITILILNAKLNCIEDISITFFKIKK